MAVPLPHEIERAGVRAGVAAEEAERRARIVAALGDAAIGAAKFAEWVIVDRTGATPDQRIPCYRGANTGGWQPPAPNPMERITDPAKAITNKVTGEVLYPFRFTVCLHTFSDYKPKTAEQLAAAREKREAKSQPANLNSQPMITALAPLGATHTITLVLAYGEVPKPPTADVSATEAAALPQQHVTVTAYLKPTKSGETKTLQFAGPVPAVQRELAEKLPLAVGKITAHLATLDLLDAELKAEQEKAQKEHEQKKQSAANTVRTGNKTTTRYPSKPASSKKPAPKPAAKPAKPAPKPAAKPTAKPAAEALKKIVARASTAAAAAKAKPASPPPLPDATMPLPLDTAPAEAAAPRDRGLLGTTPAPAPVSLADLAKQFGDGDTVEM